jgi:hypothetical protein
MCLMSAGCSAHQASFTPHATSGRSTAVELSSSCRRPDHTLATLAAQLKAGKVSLRSHRLVGGPTEPRGQIPLGIQADLRSRSGPDLGDVLMRMHDAHLRFSREDFSWSTIEPRPGVFCWAQTDFWMYGAARAGIQIIAVPDAAPAWAEPSQTTAPTDQAGTRAYAAFVRQLLGRYGSYGSFWNLHPSLRSNPVRFVDVWNEPYSKQFWSRSFPDPAGYARIFEAVVHAARPVDRRARFLLEADTTAITENGQDPFLTAVLREQPAVARDAYAVSVHPYASNGWGPSFCDPTAAASVTRFQFCRIRQIRRILDSHHASRVRLMITELGWSIAPQNSSGVSVAALTAYIHETFTLLRTRWKGLVSGLIWYDYQSPQRDPASLNDFYGLVQPDGVPGPGWPVLAEEAQRGIPGRL